MPLLLLSDSLSARDAAFLAARSVAYLGSGVEIAVGLPDDLRDYQRSPDGETLDYGDFKPLRAAAWGEAREGWIPIEIPPEGLLLPGDPDLPSARRAARAEQIANELAADTELHAAVTKLRAERAAR